MSGPSTNGSELELEDLGAGTAAPASMRPKMLVPLFVVPLLIVAVVVGIFTLLGSVLGREKTVEQWIDQLETGGVNERWQAAAPLAEMAGTDPGRLADPRTLERLRHVFATAGPSEPRIRLYLAKLWTAVPDPQALPLVLSGIERSRAVLAHPEASKPEETENAGTELIYYVRALGTIGTGAAEAALLPFAGDADAKVRQGAAESLGVLGRGAMKAGGAPSPALLDALLKLHDDADAWVRMNAALGLGKLGRTEGLPTLEAMLDRQWLRRQGLRFPDDGKYSVTQHDPAEEPIGFALFVLDSLVEESERGGPPVDLASLRAALGRAAEDPNPELKRRAKALLEKLET